MLEPSVSKHVYTCTQVYLYSCSIFTVINRANYSGPPTELDEDNTIIIGDSTCIPINGSVHINCSTYQSNLVYQWSKDGEVVTNPSPPNILTVTQRGNYTCTATNSSSTENATSWIESMANVFLSVACMNLMLHKLIISIQLLLPQSVFKSCPVSLIVADSIPFLLM